MIRFFADNYFMSVELRKRMTAAGKGVCSTMRKDRDEYLTKGIYAATQVILFKGGKVATHFVMNIACRKSWHGCLADV